MLISLAKTHEPHILMTRPLWPGFFGETPRLQGARPIRSLAMLYFIRSGQYVKIGVADNPWERLSNFQIASPEKIELLAVAPGSSDEEARHHSMFSKHHARGNGITPATLSLTLSMPRARSITRYKSALSLACMPMTGQKRQRRNGDLV